MHITVTNGDRTVEIRIKGHSAKALARAEATALRLLTSGPEPQPKPAPFGYSVTAEHELSSTDQVDSTEHTDTLRTTQGTTPSPAVRQPLP
ncbi:hypothetical protein SCAB_61051 [Streptomyces scabiei 87.22]|uniref:Uncharacterized protein n=1 Tax=Streptomyces scabiei (strain 87.22) TaxID=680198 RepID=C9Z936_STRSW|nr:MULTISPECIES: hypothetical protein [Streptomyces]MBP5875669.1 hypothetical protein [Streptomyces sp. LBUM 1477]MDX2652124.1 hypothetical protein [Streptomyces scabiei]MDX2725850.1 hypothetical protein [Streptomyces scabiei]MDX2749640.1 hypothetical protein [Streptomyces scabiei]MDX2863969.1 hypothetical protein [Streptomyces scabiei]